MAYPTDRTLYFRLDSTSGTQDGTADTAGNSGTAAFESLEAALAYVVTTDADLTGQGSLTLKTTQGGVEAPTSVITFSGITTTASDYLVIECEGDARHDGISREKSGTGYQMKRSGDGIQVTIPYIRFIGMEICTSGNSYEACLISNSGGASSDIRFNECLFACTDATSTATYAVFQSANNTLALTNCLIIANGHRAMRAYAGPPTIDHCGAAAAGSYGFVLKDNATVTNTFAVLSATEDFYDAYADPTGSHNASEDVTATAFTGDTTNSINSITLANEFTNATVDPATADFTLVAGGELIAAGTGSETIDIAGATRTGTADIGPFNYAAAASTTPVIQDTAFTQLPTSNTDIVCTAPSGIEANDLLIILAAHDSQLATAAYDDASKPSGWTFLIHSGNDSSDAHLGIFYKIATGSEGNATVVANESNDQCAWYIRVSGVDTTTPINVTGTPNLQGSSGSNAIPSVTTDVDDCLAFYFFVMDGYDATDMYSVSGTGWSEYAEGGSATSGSDIGACWGTKDQTSFGATGNATVSWTPNDGNTGVQFAVAPAAASTTPFYHRRHIGFSYG